MSNLWRLNRHLLFDEGPAPTFPCELLIQFEMYPPDFFGVESAVRTAIANMEPADITININTGIITAAGSIPEMIVFDLTLDKGRIDVYGNWGLLTYLAENDGSIDQCIEWLTVRMTTMLTIQTGIYFEIRTLDGLLGVRKFSAIHDAENLSLSITSVDAKFQNDALQTALTAVSHHCSAYRRFEVASRYYLHARRLISPLTVNFPPYTVCGEVLLNLMKCLEILFATDKRRLIRVALTDLGLTTDEIETQIIPITLIRNEFDIGHGTHGLFAAGDIPTLRHFVNRSLANMQSLLKRVQLRIGNDPAYLHNIHTTPSKEHTRLIADLNRYLEQPELGAPPE